MQEKFGAGYEKQTWRSKQKHLFVQPKTNYVKFHNDKTAKSLLCRLCGEKGESVNHIFCECRKLA